MAIVNNRDFKDLKSEYASLWKDMKIRDEWVDRINAAAAGIIGGKTTYTAVQSATGAPWFVVGLLHQMESERNFSVRWAARESWGLKSPRRSDEERRIRKRG